MYQVKEFSLGVHILVRELDPFKVALDAALVDDQGVSS